MRPGGRCETGGEPSACQATSTVAPPTAQAAMRHLSLDLTMNVCTDPRLLDVAGALETLPDLSLQGVAQADAGTGEPGA